MGQTDAQCARLSSQKNAADYLFQSKTVKYPSDIARQNQTTGDGNCRANISKQAFDAANLNYSPLEVIWEKLDSASQRVILNGYDEKSQQNLMRPPDVLSDIYSLGATLYHLLTGQMPVDALERSIAVLEGNPDPLLAPDEIDPNIAVEISGVLIKALKIRRENRFASALEMSKELENAFVQLKERKTRELRNEVPAAPAVPFVKPKPLPPKVQNAAKIQNAAKETPKNLSEEGKQLELYKQKCAKPKSKNS